MEIFTGELVGTALLVFLGDGVVAGVTLRGSKSAQGGWIVVTAAWALAVTLSVYAVGSLTGAHLNPAVTLGMAVTGKLPWGLVITYCGAQLLGAILGAVLVYLQYLPHWAGTEDAATKLGVFCTAPAIRHTPSNLLSEALATFVLLFGLSALGAQTNSWADGLKPLAVGGLIFSIGLSLGGTTRDLGPRLAHALLPIPGKGSSDWGYAWIPVAGPIVGAIGGALTYQWLF
jgi:glycerol uptake facilitator protein